jgi:hypothetical protein
MRAPALHLRLCSVKGPNLSTGFDQQRRAGRGSSSWPCPSSTVFSDASSRAFAPTAQIARRRIPRSSCSAASWPCFAARSPVPTSPGPTVPSSPSLLVSYLASVGIVPHHAADNPRLAPLACSQALDLPAPQTGPPCLPNETVELILRLGRENPRWGYLRIGGELKRLGVTVSKTSVAATLRRHVLPGSPARGSDLNRVPLAPGQRHRGH